MKLEAVNGNLLSLTAVNQEQQEKMESTEETLVGEGGEENEAEPQHSEDNEKEVGGKKKGTRKKRSLNWEEAERALLVEVIKPKVDFVDNRNVDAKSIKTKRLAWLHITKQFNALNFRHRSLEQIQVQWRSMKNSAKREHQLKNPKSLSIEGIEMIEFMEELLKDPISARSQSRGNIKKEPVEIDDEDTPLAALPTSISTSEDTTQTSRIIGSSPPPAEESQSEPLQSMAKKKKNLQGKPQQNAQGVLTVGLCGKPKRQWSQNSNQSESNAGVLGNDVQCSTQASPHTINALSPLPPADDRYKKQIFEMMKRARLSEMEYARREHEQKLRFEQMEQDMKLSYYRQQEELKLRQLREEHEARMHHWQLEHEARMQAYTLKAKKSKPPVEHNDGGTACN